MRKRKYKSKYRTEAERRAAKKAYQAAYRQSKKDGTWRPKKEIGKERVIDLLKGVQPVEEPTADDPIEETLVEIWKETGLKGLKEMTPEERRAAKAEYQRRYRALKRRRGEKINAKAATPRKRPKFATEEERRAAKNEYDRKYHLLRKTGLWVRRNKVFSERIAKSAGVRTEQEILADALRGQQSGAATPEEQRERLRAYNRDYRRRRRAEALAEAQKTWSAEEWAKWNARQEAKERGEPVRFVKDVVKFIAQTGGMTEDAVMEHLLERGGVEFLLSGAQAIGRDRAKKPSMVKAAARAVAFYIDPDGAVMFPKADEGRA